ncbi:MAG: diguanylate cyclase [Pseudobutyrivibrio sp.]|nr:diguanylate cyclase [Pseudobutyrivibrio sp.]
MGEHIVREGNNNFREKDFSDAEILYMLRDLPDACCIFQVMTDPFGTVMDMQFLFANEKYAKLVGRNLAELIGSMYYETVTNRDEDWIKLSYQAAILRQSAINRTYNTEFNKWFEFWIVPVYKKGYCAYIIHDVTAEQRKEKTRLVQDKTNKMIIKCAKDITSNDFKKGIKLVLKNIGEAINADRVFMVECTDDRQAGDFYFWTHKNTGTGLPTEKEFARFDFFTMWDKQLNGENIFIMKDTAPIEAKNKEVYDSIIAGNVSRYIISTLVEKGRTVGYILAENYDLDVDFDIKNVFETTSMFIASEMVNYKLTQEMTYLSHHDVLTGLGNRYSLTATQKMLLKMKVPVGVCYCDINGLKEVNDKKGHQDGDDLIKLGGEIFANVFREKFCYRIGGDEFIAVIPEMKKEKFEALVDKLEEKLEKKTKDISMAVGWTWVEDSKEIEEAIRKADIQMYKNKADYYIARERRKK